MWENQIEDIIQSGRVKLSNIKPSDWTEQNVMMGKPFPGPFRYSRTPYTKEIIDCFAEDHPARVIAVMKAAQIGFSAGVIHPAIGWIISQSPGNSYLSVGHDDLIEEAMGKVDKVIDNAGIRNLIRPDIERKRNNKTGDTNKKKEFAGGYLIVGSANNHKVLRQRDLQYGFIDDFESIKQGSKESGSTKKLIEQRFAAYADKAKIAYISTPELKQTSNIYPAYMEGDQRKWKVPCPCCGVQIELQWQIKLESGDNAGITWKTDNHGKLIEDSVGYVCQECAGFFNDTRKFEMNENGTWVPTATPRRSGYYSYHINALYAPAGMYQWIHYVSDYLDATKDNIVDERKYKTFVNLCLGEPYEPSTEKIKAHSLEQNNIRNYNIGVIPKNLSETDGNGEVIILTCAADMNGTVDDARLDFEVRAWSESGSSYSIYAGSIGTFVPRENTIKNKVDRERWTYEHGKHNSVWDEFEKIINQPWSTDKGKKFKIFATGLDTGHYTNYAYAFIDKTKGLNVFGLKGDKESVARKLNIDAPYYKPARERQKLYIVDVSLVKDVVANQIKLNWDSQVDPYQPPGFINFPTPSDGMYLYKNYFSHFESERRQVVDDKDGNPMFTWKKVTSTAQNHFWDCAIYNFTMKEIIAKMICQRAKLKSHTWNDFCKLLLG